MAEASYDFTTVRIILNFSIIQFIVTRCAYAQGRVKRLSPSIYILIMKKGYKQVMKRISNEIKRM